MAARISLAEAQAWLEQTKLVLPSLDASMEAQISSQILGRLSAAYPAEVATWTTEANTPQLVRSIISMFYAGWFYDRQYSENPEDNSYADRLRAWAEQLLMGLLEGTIDIPEVPGQPAIGEPAFFPTDTSSANEPTDDNPSDGGPKFLMGKVF
jgi:hypothetical protein